MLYNVVYSYDNGTIAYGYGIKALVGESPQELAERLLKLDTGALVGVNVHAYQSSESAQCGRFLAASN